MDSLLKYWINSIPLERCALLEESRDLIDGRVLVDLASFVEGGAAVLAAETSTTDDGRVRSVICFLAERHSWSSMPHPLRQANASERIAGGDEELAMLLVKYIKFVFDCYVEADEALDGGAPVVDPGQRRSVILNRPQAAIVKEKDMTSTNMKPALGPGPSSSTNKKSHPEIRKKSPNRSHSAPLKPRPMNQTVHQAIPAPVAAPSRTLQMPQHITASPPRPGRNDQTKPDALFSTKPSIIHGSAQARIASYPAGDLASERRAVEQAQLLQSPAAPPPLSPQQRAEIIVWLEGLGVYSASVSHRRIHYAAPDAGGHFSVDKRLELTPFQDPWCNGVLLSELAAVLCKSGDKSIIKEIPAVCACGVSKPEHFDRWKDLTERSSQRGSRTTSAGVELESGLGWHRDRPRIVIAGTVILVKSMAQILKNIQFALAILRDPDMTGLPKAVLLPLSMKRNRRPSVSEEDIMDCQPDDVITGRVSIWHILRRVYLAHKSANERSTRASSRSRSPVWDRRPATSQPSPARTQDNTCCEIRRSFTGMHEEQNIAKATKEPTPRSSICNEESSHSPTSSIPEQKALRSALSNSTTKSMTLASGSGSERRQDLRQSTPTSNKRLVQPEWNGTTTPQRHMKATAGLVDVSRIWGAGPPALKSTLRSRSVSPKRNPLMQRLSATVDDPSACNAVTMNPNRKLSKATPRTENLDRDIIMKDALPPVTSQQQEALRRWIIDLGIEFRDGDGGFVSRSFGTTVCVTTQLQLHEDRLRSGLTLCDLALVLEPNAARHLKIDRLVRKSIAGVKSMEQAMRCVASAMLLFRVRRCPPIPLQFLLHPELVLKGRKNAIWGLLWEIMQAYPSVTVGRMMDSTEAESAMSTVDIDREAVLLTAPSMKGTEPTAPLSPDSVTAPQGPLAGADPWAMSSLSKYLPQVGKDISKNFTSRRKKERDICDWIQDLRLEGHLQNVVGLYAIHMQDVRAGQNSVNVSSLQQLENTIRNGTLLCSVVGGIFDVPIKAWSKSPKSYNQCLGNVDKAIDGIRRIQAFPQDILYGGIADDIVRGEWSVIVELLHQLCSLPRDRVALFKRREHLELKRERPIWEDPHRTEIVPTRPSVYKPVTSKDTIESASKDPTKDIFLEELFHHESSALHLPDEGADLYPSRAGPTEPGHTAHRDADLDTMLGIGDVLPAAAADSEVAAILGESISSKLIRELEEAANSSRSAPLPLSSAPPPPLVQISNTIMPPDITPTSNVNAATRRGTRGDMILVERLRATDKSGAHTQGPIGTVAVPKTPISRSSLDAPDWVREIKAEGVSEKRPLNKDHDEVQSVQDSPSSTAGDVKKSKHDALLDAITKKNTHNRGKALTQSSSKRHTPPRGNSAPPSKRLPPTVNYNTHPLPQTGQDVLTSKRIRDVKLLMSWMTDLNVDTEPLKDLIRIVRSREADDADGAYGYVNPIPGAFPKKDISTTISPQSIPGTVKIAKYHAQRLQNIRRAFEVLSNNNKIPLSALTCEEAILEGRVDAVVTLLMKIRKAYSITVS